MSPAERTAIRAARARVLTAHHEIDRVVDAPDVDRGAGACVA
jgi:hypothetical protein